MNESSFSRLSSEIALPHQSFLHAVQTRFYYEWRATLHGIERYETANGASPVRSMYAGHIFAKSTKERRHRNVKNWMQF
jgi:hypothetical protein